MRSATTTRTSTRAEAGFTLIELMLTVVILMIGIVSVAKLVPVSIASDVRNRNDTTSLIAAQTLLEQMMQQSLTLNVPGCLLGDPSVPFPPPNVYSFCDGLQGTGYGIALGRSNATTGAPTSDGCPVNSLGQIDFTVACSSSSGYSQIETNPVTGAQMELRWRVVEIHDPVKFTPIRKVFIVGARLVGTNNFSNTTPSLVGVVSQ